jgi:hypothetical protein
MTNLAHLLITQHKKAAEVKQFATQGNEPVKLMPVLLNQPPSQLFCIS